MKKFLKTLLVVSALTLTFTNGLSSQKVNNPDNEAAFGIQILGDEDELIGGKH